MLLSQEHLTLVSELSSEYLSLYARSEEKRQRLFDVFFRLFLNSE
jgi:hypothetical protein